MDGERFLDVARDLVKKNKEAYNRSAVNRGYYAAYNKSVKFFNDINIPVSEGPEGHEEVKKYFNNCGIQDGKKINKKLVDLYSERIKADYRMKENKFKKNSTCKTYVKIAENIIKGIEKLKKKYDMRKMTGVINKYRKDILKHIIK